MGVISGHSMTSSEGFLLGRRTYEEWAAFWPTQAAPQNPVAPMTNQRPTYVLSQTLHEATWNTSTGSGVLSAQYRPVR